MHKREEVTYPHPLPISRALRVARRACGVEKGDDSGGGAACHDAALGLADAITCYLGAVAVAQYSQALLTGNAEADPTLNRSLRSLRRVLRGQWLLWTARGLAAAPDGPVEGLPGWYAQAGGGLLAEAYTSVRAVMVQRMSYEGEYGPRDAVSPRLLLELLDQYSVRLGKLPPDTLSAETKGEVGRAALSGLHALLEGGASLATYPLYAPQQRKLLMGLEETSPMPPMHTPPGTDEAATLLLYPPGETPDYTKRPKLGAERMPLFPLDPLLTYLYCKECDAMGVAALQEVAGDAPTYKGLDPQCGHGITLSAE